MSIVEKIKETELEAEQIKTKATEEVKAMLDETVSMCILKSSKSLEEAKEKIALLNKETLEKINQIEKKKLEDAEKFNQEEAKLAKTHEEEAIDFIYKKVIES